MSSKVAATTGGLFHEPSVSIASSVLPRFQPGFKAAKKFEAEMALNAGVAGHFTVVPFPASSCQLDVLRSSKRYVYLEHLRLGARLQQAQLPSKSDPSCLTQFSVTARCTQIKFHDLKPWDIHQEYTSPQIASFPTTAVRHQDTPYELYSRLQVCPSCYTHVLQVY